ncbi:hypothetical protein H6776_00225 [Candidatus Nomurabacteria bacterium]|nr:hypothetical protein [Candidatus Nomurabacteria bacterium]
MNDTHHSLKNILPSKRFGLTILGLFVGVIFVLVVMALVQRKKNQPLDTTPQQGLLTGQDAVENFQKLQKQDSDNDGVLDWEEALWGTNPLLADTDGDGISDFDEIEEVKVAINAANTESDAEIGEGQENSSEELTKIDLISRDLYSTIAVLDQQGALEENEDQVTELFQESIVRAFDYDLFSIGDIILTSQSAETVSQYLSDMKDITGMYLLDENDFIFIANDSTKTTKSEEAFAVLDKYEEFLKSLLEVSVPVEYQKDHLNIVNSVAALRFALETILYSDQDPMTGLSALLQLEDIINFYVTAVSKFSL